MKRQRQVNSEYEAKTSSDQRKNIYAKTPKTKRKQNTHLRTETINSVKTEKGNQGWTRDKRWLC